MADIFISCASGDRTRVLPLVKSLEAQGWSLFWDWRSIPEGKTWRHSSPRTWKRRNSCWCPSAARSRRRTSGPSGAEGWREIGDAPDLAWNDADRHAKA